MKNVDKHMEEHMLCTIDGETFHPFTKRTCIGNSGASCHVTNDDTCLYDVTNINKLEQGSLGDMSSIKKYKVQMKVCQIDSSKRLHVLSQTLVG